MNVLLRNFVIIALIASGLQSPAVGVDFSTEEGAKSIIENVVLGTLPNPMGDLVSLVKSSPEIVKGALIVWFNRKMADAEPPLQAIWDVGCPEMEGNTQHVGPGMLVSSHLPWPALT